VAFKDTISFRVARFREFAWFQDATFAYETDFTRTTFSGPADLSQATVEEIASFPSCADSPR